MGCHARAPIGASRQANAAVRGVAGDQDEAVRRKDLDPAVLGSPDQHLRGAHGDSSQPCVADSTESSQHSSTHRVGHVRRRGVCRGFGDARSRLRARGRLRRARGTAGSARGSGGRRGSSRRLRQSSGATARAFPATHHDGYDQQCRKRRHSNPTDMLVASRTHREPVTPPAYWIHRLVASTRPGRSSTLKSAGSATSMPTNAPAIRAVPGTAPCSSTSLLNTNSVATAANAAENAQRAYASDSSRLTSIVTSATQPKPTNRLNLLVPEVHCPIAITTPDSITVVPTSRTTDPRKMPIAEPRKLRSLARSIPTPCSPRGTAS